MFAVVVDRMAGDPAQLAGAAASVLGGTAYDMRASMNVPEGGPAVLSVVADAAVAEHHRAGLQQAGFFATVVAVDRASPRFEVRRFELTGQGLAVESRTSEQLVVPWTAIDVLIHATAVTSTTTTTTVKERKLSLGRSALTGGLINTKVQKSQRTTRSTDSDEALYVFAGAAPPLLMSEHGLQYQGLGPATQPSRTANFRYTVAQIRQHAPQARYDERLRRRATQTQTLGHTLPPDQHLDLAINLIAHSLRTR